MTCLIIRWLPIAAALAFVGCNPAWATELVRITHTNYRQVVPAGKEVDAIVGDYVLRNNHVTAVIAQATAGRKANMTVRGVAGTLIDFTRRHHGSDQLSCFYPAGGRYLFEMPEAVACQVDGESRGMPAEPEAASSSGATAGLLSHQGKAISLSFTGQPISADGTTATVTYRLQDDQAWLEYEVTLDNSSSMPVKLPVEDALRCDGSLFELTADEPLGLVASTDQYFGQSYGFMLVDATLTFTGSGRNVRLKSSGEEPAPVPAGEHVTWTGRIYCSQGLPGVRSWAHSQQAATATQPVQLMLQSDHGPVARAAVELMHQDKSLGVITSDAEGVVRSELVPGEYQAVVRSHGRQPRTLALAIEAGKPHAQSLTLAPASRVRAEITDDQGAAIAAKVQFIGLEGTPDPDFGPDSAAEAVRNVVYCPRGTFEQPMDPGRYRVLISHGPEYDADTQELQLAAGQVLTLKSQLPRTVDTRGWVSAEFHSHSSPSGDNVSDQRGRVLNLLAEHLEFAPCTEHNRIDTYEDDLHALRATPAMATCSGMELTGSPLPINHQNAFPLHRHEHEQDGGGPQTDADPVKQIERLALWDNSSVKVVQTNHPNIPQILGDSDLDGVADNGFRGMLGWMDVIEVHPLQNIFATPAADEAPQDKNGNRIFYWLQLLNLGYRIPGVANTDAHYNFHGSGWLRNYLASSSDDPPHISLEEMIHSAEHGHMVMTTGPFLQVALRVGDQGPDQLSIPGDDVRLQPGAAQAKLWIRVQCPNWFDVNRVQVFANGRPLPELNFTRQSHPQLFSEEHVRFEYELDIPPLQADTHLIVATIGDGLTLGPVMGPDAGKLPPVAVSNPIFVDVDGSGFQANGDDLGVPFMLPKKND